MCHRVIRELGCHPASVTYGRRFAADALATWGMGPGSSHLPVRDHILLVTTELLSNAVKAASGPVRLSLEGHLNRVDISVADDNPSPAVRLGSSLSSSGGRGLLLVEALSERWGQRPLTGLAKEVWAEVAVPGEGTLAVSCTHLPR